MMEEVSSQKSVVRDGRIEGIPQTHLNALCAILESAYVSTRKRGEPPLRSICEIVYRRIAAKLTDLGCTFALFWRGAGYGACRKCEDSTDRFVEAIC